MEVAVLAGRHLGGVGEEGGHGLLAGAEVVAQHLVAGQQLNPLDVVLGEHGVERAAHLHAVASVYPLYYGHVLLAGGVGGVLVQEAHGLSAAGEGALAGAHHFNHVAAGGATVNLIFLCHKAVLFG